MSDTLLKAAGDLQSALVGQFYGRFGVHTGFELEFEHFVLAAQEIESPEEELLNAGFVQSYPPASFTANPQLIAQSAILAACLGVSISTVQVAADASLTLGFENGVRITLPTSTPVVDWHWAITEGRADPYSGCIIACFAPGEIQGGIANFSYMDSPTRARN